MVIAGGRRIVSAVADWQDCLRGGSDDAALLVFVAPSEAGQETMKRIMARGAMQCAGSEVSGVVELQDLTIAKAIFNSQLLLRDRDVGREGDCLAVQAATGDVLHQFHEADETAADIFGEADLGLGFDEALIVDDALCYFLVRDGPDWLPLDSFVGEIQLYRAVAEKWARPGALRFLYWRFDPPTLPEFGFHADHPKSWPRICIRTSTQVFVFAENAKLQKHDGFSASALDEFFRAFIENPRALRPSPFATPRRP